MELRNLAIATVQNNNVANANIAYILSNVSSTNVKNNVAYVNTVNGIVINNSILDNFQNNNFMTLATGMLCLSKSIGSSNNTDFGGNMCNTNVNCLWLKSSAPQCP